MLRMRRRAQGVKNFRKRRAFATEAVFGFNSLWFHAPQMNPMNYHKTISKGGLKCSKSFFITRDLGESFSQKA
jgi:hypothetical protein